MVLASECGHTAPEVVNRTFEIVTPKVTTDDLEEFVRQRLVLRRLRSIRLNQILQEIDRPTRAFWFAESFVEQMKQALALTHGRQAASPLMM